ncbi:MAG: NFYB/HAP3 family transcription factor subunit [Candidatus Lokiarchaeota archaeon]|uniref:Transcription factor CBF/NF-Y/archaeal histone domain-containing protein n=1 Tax=marine sediment metagenome TaxID=412755 RepID=X1AQU8_9ZZZZ|nr:NFYB/HAP3 family transcription factor subunit [Candidatus Lokiarchaeota archaeon]
MAKKEPAKKKGAVYIAKAPIRRLMKSQGAKLVAAEALNKLIGYLENAAADITKESIKLTKADKRKRITALDIRNATR